LIKAVAIVKRVYKMTAHYSSLKSWDLNNSAFIFRRGLPTTPESLACGCD